MENYQKALAIRLEANGQEHSSTGNTYHNIGIILSAQGKYEKAMEIYKKALAIYLKAAGPNHPITGMTYYSIGRVLYHQKKYKKAMENLQKALAIELKVNGPSHPDNGMTYQCIGEVLQKQSKHIEANAWFKEALRVKQNGHGPSGHPNNIAMIYDFIVKELIRNGKMDDAMNLLDQAIGILLKNSKEGHPDLALMYIQKADLLRAKFRNEDAAEMYDKAIAIRKQIFGEGHCLVDEVVHKKSELPQEQGT